MRKKIAAVEEWISAIENDITREVFEARYLRGWSWSKIAASLGYVNEDYPRIRIHDKYLRDIGVK